MTRIFLCLAFAALGIIDQSAQKSPDREERWRGSVVSAVKLASKNEEWHFRGHRDGITARCRKDGTELSVDLDLQGKVKNVSRIVAASGEGFGNTFMALGVECVSDDGKRLEYRMISGNCHGNKPFWTPSIILAERPIDDAFILMGIATAGGDSVMLTLQSMKRDYTGKSDHIETHTFLDHCPVPNSLVTQHYHEPRMKRITTQMGLKKKNLEDSINISSFGSRDDRADTRTNRKPESEK